MHDLIFLLELEKLSLNVILLWGVLVSCEFWKKTQTLTILGYLKPHLFYPVSQISLICQILLTMSQG